MWEKTFDELELETQPKSFLFDLPSLKEKTDPILIIFIILTSSFIVVVSIKFRIFHLWAEFLGSNLFLRISTYPLLISAVIIVSGVIFRTIIWFRYKPQTIESGASITWPFVSVIMPALNEEELIEKSIASIFNSNYPQNKLEVICINDGSTDLTFFYMLRAKQLYGDKLKVVNFRENLGKRKALYVGLKKSRGEIICCGESCRFK
jgi:hyaluronan synthase